MKRHVTVLLLTVACASPLAAQSADGADGREATPVGQATTVHAKAEVAVPGEPADTAFAGRSQTEAALAGALVGAVTGAVLTTQESDCAPDSSAGRASIIGAAMGALRGALGLGRARELPLPDSGDSGGQEAPYPFDGERCDHAEGGSSGG